jgi:hypothetical protein
VGVCWERGWGVLNLFFQHTFERFGGLEGGEVCACVCVCVCVSVCACVSVLVFA